MSEVKVNKISPRTACGTVTLGDSGDTFTVPCGVTISNAGTATGFGATGAVNWDTASIKTAGFTAASGNGYFCNTTSGAFTVALPAGAAGSIISVQDYDNTFDSNGLTINPNGSEKINGGTAGKGILLDTEGLGITFVYIDSTVGWRSVQSNEYAEEGQSYMVATGGAITCCGTDKIHTFTGPGTFTVCSVAAGSAAAANNLVSYLVVAGGASGMGKGAPDAYSSAGGGAGGFREVKSPSTPYTASPLDGYPSAPNRITVTATGYPITVGGGGAGVCGGTPVRRGNPGNDSIFSTITSAGGGGGGMGGTAPAVPVGAGLNGGSGGGGGASPTCAGISGLGGSGNTPPTTPAQGFDGGTGSNGWYTASGGGGGATTLGVNAVATPSPGAAEGGDGGAGGTTEIIASPVAYAGGGGGGSGYPGACGTAGSTGGTGGGGAGSNTGSGTAGGCNTGGGGGGAGGTSPTANGGAGGSGIVIIRYRYQN